VWEEKLPVQYGKLTLSEGLFDDAIPDQYILPTDTDLERFRKSQLSNSGFSYLDGGHFYRPHGETLESRVSKLFKRKSVNKNLIASTVMSECKPGDVRARHRAYAPRQMSVFGMKRGNRIEKSSFAGYNIGSTSKQMGSAAEMLKDLAPERSDFVGIQLILAFGIIYNIFRGTRDDKLRICNLVLGGLMVLFARSWIWRKFGLWPELWGIVLFIGCSLYWIVFLRG
jgi:hypothetical protein